MPSSFRSRLTRRHAPTTTPSTASVYSSAASAAVGYAGDAYGNSYSGRSFLGRRSIGGSGGGGNNNKQNQQPSQQSNSNSQQRGHHTSSSNYTITSPLATFDACIEACDALAASSASSPWQTKQQPSIISNTVNDPPNKVASGNNDEDNNDTIILSSNEKLQDDDVASGGNSRSALTTSTEIQNTHSSVVELVPDCSVLVSPDGALLFTSSISTLSNQSNISRSNNNSNQKNLLNDNDNSAPHGGTMIAGETDAELRVEQQQQHDVVPLVDNDRRYPWTQISPDNCDGAILSEEYESAVITGNDLTPNGDYDSNGFSATGWDMDAATVALSASRDVLAGMSNFLETLATCRKQEAICVRAAVETLGDVRIQLERRYYERRRMGPMVLSETKLSAAIEAMEEYYAQSSDCELERWKMACSSRSPLQARTSSTVEPRNELNYTKDNERGAVNYDAPCGRHYPSELIYGMLPQLQTATTKATSRTLEREHALSDMRSKLLECETILREQKIWASSQWKRVAEEESNIDRLYAIKKMEQHEFYEGQRRKKLLQEEEEDGVEGASSSVHHSTNEESDIRIEEEEPLSKEVWMMVQNVTTSMEDFGHTGYSPKARTRKEGESSSNSAISSHRRREQQLVHQQSSTTPSKIITRADVERESEIQDLKMVAQAADEAVEDAAGKLLNTMSKGDTTLRSARLAAESCLLSECNAARNCLRSLVAMERASLQDRLRQLDILETAVNEIDVRKDIDNYIKSDKAISGGRSRDGEEDGGGIAAALAVLNSHGENCGGTNSSRKYRNIERPSYFEGWAEPGGDVEAEGDVDEVEPEIFGEVINMLFGDCSARDSVAEYSDEQCVGSGGSKDNPTRHVLPPNDSKIETASNALRSKQGNIHRKSILYELNNQRSKKTWVEERANFDALCRVFDAFLSGCGREPSDVSNAMMLMILSQTFYIEDRTCDEGNNHGNVCDDGSSTRKNRQSRIYVKSTICHHEIWNDEDFWDQAVYQCVSESLSKSGVLMNYVKLATNDGKDITGRQPRCIKWHDLSPDEYAGAATQVHSVLFAQLGTLSHSMLELGCGIPRACNFVRRLSIRYQLPLSLRVTLMQHLTRERR